jgi:hypothetical protein
MATTKWMFLFMVMIQCFYAGKAKSDENFIISTERSEPRKKSFNLIGYADNTEVYLYNFVSNNDADGKEESSGKFVSLKGVRDVLEKKLGKKLPKSGPYYVVRSFPISQIEVKAKLVTEGVYEVTDISSSAFEIISNELNLYEKENSKIANSDQKHADSEKETNKKKVLSLRKRDPSMTKRCSLFLSRFAGKIESLANSTSIKESDAEAIVKLSLNSKEEKMNCMSFWFEEEQNRYALASTCGQYLAMGPGMIKECYEKSKEE